MSTANVPVRGAVAEAALTPDSGPAVVQAHGHVPAGAVYRPGASAHTGGVLGSTTFQAPSEGLPAFGLKTRWRWRTPSAGDGSGGHPPPGAAAARGSDGAASGPLLDRVLRARGLAVGGASGPDPATAAFLDPRLTHLHDPSTLPGLDRAAQRILHALDQDEPIVIYGDYDADGVTATAILIRTLRALRPGADIRGYIPHRLDEGYGLNEAALGQLAAEGARVVVSVDCGITAVREAEAARALGLDLIITDHHHPPQHASEVPAAFAVVHPRLPGSGYPFGELCGAGVAYKLAWRLATSAARGPGQEPGRADAAMRTLLVELLALCALGTVADLVPLTGENRVIARFGMARMKASPLVGLRALVEAAGLDGEKVDVWDVGFRLAPRLNASGRLTHARAALELFTTDDRDRAAALAEELTELNQQRRQVEKTITDQACEQAEASGMTGGDDRAIVLADPRWHAGVVGIVCSRLVERYGRPTILLCRDDDGACHGSARSIDGFHLHAALSACAAHLERFGGHAMAAGMRVAPGRFEAFARAFIDYANQRLAPEDLRPASEVDVSARVDELTLDAVAALGLLEPCGRGNPTVTVHLPGVVLDGPPEPLGRQGDHLALTIRQAGPSAGARVLRVPAWGWGERRGQLARGQACDVLVRPEISRFSGRARVEPTLIDLAPSPT